MGKRMNYFNIVLLIVVFFFQNAYSQRLNIKLDGKNENWKVWLDKKAQWKNDSIFLPGEFKLLELPVNIPSCGWNCMYENIGNNCILPTTIEEQFGKSNDWSYHGVSWYFRSFELSSGWKNKKVILKIEKYNHRIEVFVNEKLVGYDAVGLLSYQCDITNALKFGERNRIALRITSIGGNRGWEDYFLIKWGNQVLVPDKDYSGVGGISLIGVDQSYIQDVFIKNLLPARANRISVEADIWHSGKQDVNAKYEIKIVEKKTRRKIFSKRYNCVLQNGNNKLCRELVIPEAKLWSEYSPELYDCNIQLKTQNSEDDYSQSFGFRVFEVKESNGRTHYYLNGNRIRLKSAIDWSIYAFNGLFPSDVVAKRSIEGVKSIGHNSLNFHRRLGDTSMFNNADSLGVYIYEEPGGFHSGGQGECNIDTFRFAKKQMYERLKRMVLRDRNHPSLLIYTLCNEDNMWTLAREMGMRLIHSYDPTRLIVNSSGGVGGGYSEGGIAHIRPYENEIRKDYNDHHTIWCTVALEESDLNRDISKTKINGKPIDHITDDSLSITYWGEVRCYAGTFNYPLIYSQGLENGKGYDLSLYASQSQKVKRLFESCNIKGMGQGDIKSVYDLTRYAGQGQYYTNGRLAQVILSNDFSDGYAINGWSPGPDMPDEWSSAMVDQNRNLNSFKENISYWNRPLQIAIMRLNGKYFIPGDTVKLNVFLINEGKIPQGDYLFEIKIKDGNGNYSDFSKTMCIKVAGGDTFAQTILREFSFVIDPKWSAGYITIEGKLSKNNSIVTDGKEQILLKNRKSQKVRFEDQKIAVVDWEQAEIALKEAEIPIMSNMEESSLILMGKNASNDNWKSVLKLVNEGANLILQMDSIVGVSLYKNGLLSTPIRTWGGKQTAHWDGNGSSYIDIFAGKQAMSKSGIISTRSWEADGDPRGFYPFESNYEQKAYGLYFAHSFKNNPIFKDENNTLVTFGEIKYGKGRILLNTSYWVDQNTAFSDLIFFNMLEYYCFANKVQ